jgi:hypothetical protein
MNFRPVCKTAESELNYVMSVRPSDGPHGTTRLQLHGFSLNLMLKYFSELCRQNSIALKSDEYNVYFT